MILWKRGDAVQLSPHFNTREFTCSCGICSDQRLDPDLITLLEKLRQAYGKPLTVTSGFRCARKQQMLKSQGYETAPGLSPHEIGQAADLVCEDIALLSKLADNLANNLGIANNFIHVDVRAVSPGQKRRWTYGTKTFQGKTQSA